MARDYPRESRLFAGEICRARRTSPTSSGPLKALVDAKARIIAAWADAGRIAPVDPHHLIVTIWAVTQHYADFDAQLEPSSAPTGKALPGRGSFLTGLFARGLSRTDRN